MRTSQPGPQRRHGRPARRDELRFDDIGLYDIVLRATAHGGLHTTGIVVPPDNPGRFRHA